MSCNVTQGFGRNANSSYSGQGLRGHTGVDVQCGWKTKVKALWGNEYVYKIFTPDKPASDGFTGIFTIVERDGEVFEFLYGHIGEIRVREGSTLRRGEIIATEGAYGSVFQGGKECSDQASLDWGCGSHRHYQKRPIKLTSTTLTTKNYLQHPKRGMFRYDGKYCEVIDFKNGYNGCVDFTFPTDDIDETTDTVVKLLTTRELFKDKPKIYKAFQAVIDFWLRHLRNASNEKF